MKVRAHGLASTACLEETPASRAPEEAAKPKLVEPELPRTWVDGKATASDKSHASLGTLVGVAAPAVVGVVAGLVSLAAPAPALAAPNVGTAPTEPQSLGSPRADAPAPAAPTAPAPKLSSEERELMEKIGRLANARFGGDYQKLFDHYAGRDHLLNGDELTRLLSDAGVGNMFTRGAWVSGILEKLDKNGDGNLGWAELQTLANR